MALTLTVIQNHFKKMGKIVSIGQYAATPALDLEAAISGSFDQFASGLAADFAAIDAVLIPFHNQVKGIVAAVSVVSALPTYARAGIDSYLRNIVASDLGLPQATAPATVAAALKVAMGVSTPSAAVVEPSGNGGSNANGWAMVFSNYYGVALAQTSIGNSNVPDTYITPTPV